MPQNKSQCQVLPHQIDCPELKDQTNGDLSSQMFAYLHHNHFSTYLRNYSGISKLVIWSDCCGYQNKSAAIANSVLHLSVETNAPVEQKFLIPNHTQMDCGAMHGLIERKSKCDISTPREDILAAMAMAREAPFPSTVTEVY
ncbi:hypothetical protein PoB_004271700 [Plakobranchus ocellatus]|uniref:Uncharacterized protein n=1 Tax=Plakobranchus ocellatus TaxID=259542 RepID=A0AAV4BAL4_9GAST|nr:hypothetical protein PoB_004271700 [Plakobranchus ocellatus]